MKDNKNIQVIFEESLRKYNNIREITDSHDKKAATVLGFISVFIGIFLSNDLGDLISQKDYYALSSLFIGLIFLLLAFLFSCQAFWIRKIYTGAEISDLILIYTNNTNQNLVKMLVTTTSQ